MVINQKKLVIVGDFIQVIQQVFTLKKFHKKRLDFYNIKYKYHADYDFFYRMIVKKNDRYIF